MKLLFSMSVCAYDYLKVWGSDSSQSKPDNALGTFCGSNQPGLLHSELNQMNLQFVSDASVAGNGFRMEWVIDGCGGVLRKNSATFSSPDYPNPYPTRVICEWKIETDPGTKIQIVITELDLEGARDCEYDSLTIFGGPDDSSPVLSSMCQKHARNVTIEAMGNHAFVRFRSDGSIRGKGFIATYRSVEGGCGGLINAPSGKRIVIKSLGNLIFYQFSGRIFRSIADFLVSFPLNRVHYAKKNSQDSHNSF